MMKTIGLIGGMSWESTVLYYQQINRLVQHKLGGVSSCKSLLYSVEFGEIAKLQHENNWDALAEIMVNAARILENGGANCIVLCTNTMHKLAPQIEQNITIPLLHIADATAENIQHQKLKKVGLLGTKFTMSEDFLKDRIKNFGIQTIVPDEEDQDIIHHIIFDELVKGKIKQESKQKFLNVISNLKENGAEGIIAGCTEIELLIRPTYIDIPLFESAKIHAEKAVEFALT